MKILIPVVAGFGLVAASPAIAMDLDPDAKETIVVDGTDKSGYNVHGKPITNPAEPGYDPNLIVCREEDRTGSRAKRREVCLANHVWQRVAREGNAFARKMVADHAGGLWGGGS